MCISMSSIAASCCCALLLLVLQSSVSALNCSWFRFSDRFSSVPMLMMRTTWHRALSINRSHCLGYRLRIVTFAQQSFHGSAVQCSTVEKARRSSNSTAAVRVAKRRIMMMMMTMWSKNVVFSFHALANGHFIIYSGQMAGRILIEWSMPKVDPIWMAMIITCIKLGLHHLNHVIEANETFRSDHRKQQNQDRFSSINIWVLSFFTLSDLVHIDRQ